MPFTKIDYENLVWNYSLLLLKMGLKKLLEMEK